MNFNSGRARRSEIQGYARGTFVISWLLGAVLILGSQIVALMTSPGVLGAHAVVRLGPTPVVFAALVLNVLVLGLIIRRIAVQTTRGKFNARREILRSGCKWATEVNRNGIQPDDSHEPAPAVAHRRRS